MQAGRHVDLQRYANPPVVELEHTCAYIYPNAMPGVFPTFLLAVCQDEVLCQDDESVASGNTQAHIHMYAQAATVCLFALRQYSKTDFHMSFKFICERKDCG